MYKKLNLDQKACPCRNEGKLCPGLPQHQYSQQIRGCIYYNLHDLLVHTWKCPVWVPQFKRESEKLVRVLCKGIIIKMIRGLKNFVYEEGRDRLFQPEEKMAWDQSNHSLPIPKR